MKRKTTFLTSLFAIVLSLLLLAGVSLPVNAQQTKSSNETVLVDLLDYTSGGSQTSYYRGNLNEGFEGTTFPPLGWKVINGGDANTWVRYATTPITGTASAAITYGATAHNDWLITPQLAPSADNYTISFKAKNQSTSYIELFNVKLSTTENNEADFTVTLAENVGPGTTATDYSYDLSAYIGQNVYIGIQATSTDMYRLYMDEFTGPAIVLGPTNLVVTGLNKTYSKIPESLLPASMQLAAGVFNTGSVLNDATNVSFTVAETGFASTGAIVTPLENGVSQTVNAAAAWNTSSLALGTYNLYYEALHPTSNVDDRTDNFPFEVTETLYSRDAGVVAGGVGSNSAALTFGMPFDIPSSTIMNGVQVQWPATLAAADLTFAFAVYEIDGSNAVLSTVYTSADIVRTQAMQGTTVDFALDEVSLPAGRYMLAVKQLGAVNVAMGYDLKPYGVLYLGNVAASPATFAPNTSFGNLTMRMLINPSTNVVVYPKPRNLSVTDAGMAAQLNWLAPLLNNKMPEGFGADNSSMYRSDMNQPSFEQVVAGRDEGVFVPSGSKSLATRDVLYDNGPFINAPAGGPNGADSSVLQNTDLGMNTLGAGIQFTAGNRMADDFTVTAT
ncbi:MAG TPA: choice-of-anchor J domain-containing protein, partial [Bacteroidales bacterium]|nr:choice-of-anchor J domain-containing protein [Bacteroidales bacterium]